MIRGIDISNHQAHVDWQKVAATDVRFAICKATEGVSFVDSWFARNWAETRRVGLCRGAYHYALPSANSPDKEAAHFLSVVGHALGPGDLVALDMEDPAVAVGVPLVTWSLLWLRAVERAVGFKPLFYTYPSYIAEHWLGGDSALGQYGLWYADYGATPRPAPPPWQFVAIRQFTSESSVPGAGSRIDDNHFNGDTIEQLMAYGKDGGAIGQDDDAKLEAAYRRDSAGYGEKRYAAFISTAYHVGKVLRCDNALLTVDGRNLAATNPGNVLDEAEQAMLASGAMRRL